MTHKIMRSILLSTGFAVLMTLFFITILMNGFSEDETVNGLRRNAELIASGMEQGGGRYLDETDFDEGLRVTWISPGGKVIFDSVKDPQLMEDHSDRQEVRDALENGNGSSSRYSATIMHSTLNYALKLSDGSVIRVSGLHRSIIAQMVNMLGSIILILAAAALFSVVAAMVISRKIVRPINEIDLDDPHTDSSYRELEPLLNKLRTQNAKVGHQLDELKQNKEQLDLIIGSMSEGIVIADQKLNVVSYNPASAELLGSSAFTSGHNIYGMNNSEQFRKCVIDALGGRRSECVIRTGSGERGIIASPAKSMELVCGVVVFIMDVTEKNKLETMRREFTANVSHELKTPLTTIYGISDMLSSGMVKSEDVAGFGENIRNEAERLISLVSDTIALSKLDEGTAAEEPEILDVYGIAGEVLRRLEHNASEKNVTLSLDGGSVNVKADRNMFTEMLYNICDNGIKYNKQNGSLAVTVGESRKNAVITVKDTGIGIPKEQQERIFERFYRGDKSRSRKIKGTGLGLSIVKHSVMHMGGNIRVESTPDKGTAFTVELPLA